MWKVVGKRKRLKSVRFFKQDDNMLFMSMSDTLISHFVVSEISVRISLDEHLEYRELYLVRRFLMSLSVIPG